MSEQFKEYDVNDLQKLVFYLLQIVRQRFLKAEG